MINTVYNECCLTTMSRMPDNWVDMVLTSPPYDNLRKYNGSGTTTKVAKVLGRNYIGSEISAEYCDIARQRLVSLF